MFRQTVVAVAVARAGRWRKSKMRAGTDTTSMMMPTTTNRVPGPPNTPSTALTMSMIRVTSVTQKAQRRRAG